MSNRTTKRLLNSATRFQVTVDHDNGTPAWVRSVSGGHVDQELIEERTGGVPYAMKHLSHIVEFKPIEFELAMGHGSLFVDWLQDTWDPKNQNGYTRNGAIAFADFNSDILFEKHFYDAIITKVTFPALDAKSTEPGYMTFEIKPQNVTLEKKRKGDKLQTEEKKDSMKRWSMHSFRLELDCAGKTVDCSHVQKIDSFSIENKYATLHIGMEKSPQFALSKIEYPTLTVHMPESSADQVIDWYEGFRDGRAGVDEEIQGSIEFLDHSLQKVLASVDLKRVGIYAYESQKNSASETSIRQATFKIYADEMKVKFHS